MQASQNGPGKIRALFLDIDGTLVPAGNNVSPIARKAIQAARAAGCEIVLCSGRSRLTVQPVAEAIAPPLGYAIASNGGVVMHLGTGEIVCRHVLPVPVALEIIRAIVELGSEPYVYECGTAANIEFARVLHHPDLPVGPWAVPPRYQPYAELLDHLPFDPVSVNAYGPPEKMRPLVAAMQARLPADVGLIQTGSENVWGMEFFRANVSKQAGLETVAQKLGVARGEIMAIGDHLNDLEMIRWAGIGVAMGNALPEVRAAADWITASVEEEGVARAIERFILAPAS